MRFRTVIFLLFLTLLSCSRKEVPENPGTPADTEPREMVPVKLYLEVAPMEYVVDGEIVDSPPTKTDYNYQTEDAEDTHIYNVWILVYEQDGEDYVLKTSPVYVPNFTNGMSVDLPTSRNYCTILFMANTGLSEMGFRIPSTLEELKEERFAQMHTQVDLFGYDATAEKWAPRFNGTVDHMMISTNIGSIGSVGSPVPLKRAMAKIEIRVVNESIRGSKPDNQRVHLRYVRVNNVQDRSFYYTNYSDYATSKVLLRPSTASPIPSAEAGDWDMDTHNLDDWGKIISYKDFYAPDGSVWAGDTPTIDNILHGEVTPTTVLARFFVPGNVRANIPGDATSITLVGEYTQDGVRYQNVYDIPIRESDGMGNYCYAVRPNHHYTINVTIKQRGQTSETYNDGLYDFTKEELANCYILQPPLAADLARGYKIPVEKPNRFWGDSRYAANDIILQSTSSLLNEEKRGSDLAIGEDDDWWVEILWADFDFRDKVTFIRLFPDLKDKQNPPQYVYQDSDSDKLIARGRGFDPQKTGCFAFRLNGGVKGNIVIALKKRLYNKGKTKSADFIVWTWHFWITDYDPDSDPTFSASRLLGTVPGGKIWRMNNDFFTSPAGMFSDSYAMDRAIGVVDDPATPSFISQFTSESVANDIKYSKRAGLGMFYQYGRKDPLPGWNTIYYPDFSDDTKVITEAIKEGVTKNTRADIMSRFCTLPSNALRNLLGYTTTGDRYSNNNVPLSVMYPLLGLRSKDKELIWVIDDKYNPSIDNAPVMWNDPYFYEHESMDVTDNMGHHKSMFDPCPPGWVLQPRQKLGTISSHYFFMDEIDKKTGDNFDYWLITNTVISGENGPHGILVYPDGQPGTLIPSTFTQAIFFPYQSYFGPAFHCYYDNIKFKNIYSWAGYPTDAGTAYRFNLNKGQNLDKNYIKGEQGLYYQVRCIRNLRNEH